MVGVSRATLAVYVIRAAGLSLGLILSVLVARTLKAPEAGLFFAAYAIAIGASNFSKIGMDFLVMRLAVKSHDLRADLRHVLYAFFGATAFLTLPLSILVGVFFVRGKGYDGPVTLVACTFLLVTGIAALAIASVLLRVLGKPVLGSALEIGVPQIVVLIGMTIFSTKFGLNATVLIAMFACASWSSTVVALLIVRKLVLTEPRCSDRSGVAFWVFLSLHRRQLAFTTWSSLILYASVLFPTLLLLVFGSLDEVAYFSVAWRLASMVLILPSLQIVTTGIAIAGWNREEEIGHLNQLLRNDVKLSVLLMFPALVVLSLFPLNIIEGLFGATYAPAAESVIALCIGLMLSLLAGNSLQVLQIIGMSGTATTIALAAFPIWLLIGIPMVSRYGSVGAGIVFSLVLVTVSWASAFELRRLTCLVSYFSPRLLEKGH